MLAFPAKMHILLDNTMSEQHLDTEPTSDEPIFWQNGKQYIRLYYFMPEKHLMDVLFNDEIKASIPAECNDPLEFLPAFDGQQNSERARGGFISFSSHFSSSLMWSHYADSHRGVCLRFDFPIGKTLSNRLKVGAIRKSRQDSTDIIEDKKHQTSRYVVLDAPTLNLAQFETIPLFPINYRTYIAEVYYSKTRPERQLNTVIVGGVNSTVSSLEISQTFYTKSEEWAYEKEWRIFINLGCAARFDGHNFYVSGLTQFLKEIILGVRFPKELELVRASFRQALKQNPFRNNLKYVGISGISQASYHPKEYKIIVK